VLEELPPVERVDRPLRERADCHPSTGTLRQAKR